jgi:serine/threonine protein kinase
MIIVNSTDPTKSNDIIDTHENIIDIIINNDIDLVANRYRIDRDAPLVSFGGGFAKAYNCTNLGESDDKLLYCLVFDHYINPRASLIDYFKANAIERLVMPIESEVTNFSLDNKEHYVAIMEYPTGISLKEYIDINGPCSLSFLKKYILLPVVKILQSFEAIGVVHGRINIENIFINPLNNIVIVGECFSDIPFFSQKTVYCPLEIIDCLPIARGTTNVVADYYALGVVCSMMLSGNYNLLSHSFEMLLREKMEQGSYYSLINIKKISNDIKILLKGLLNDDVAERWKSKQIFDWFNNQVTSLGIIHKPNDATRALSFNDKDYYTCRYLAHGLQKSWTLAKKFILEDKINRWIERSIGDTEIAEKLERISNIGRYESANSVLIGQEELLVRYLAALDPTGPLRMKDFSISVESLPLLLLYGFARNKKEYLENAKKILKGCYWRFFTIKSDKKAHIHNKLYDVMDKIREFFDKDIMGFGMERCLYELNLNIPCQSEIFKGKMIFTVTQLLQGLDVQASLGNNEIMDSHIAAFILAKLHIVEEITLPSLANFPLLARRKELITLTILSIAQKTTDTNVLKYLSKACIDNLDPIINQIRNKSTRTSLLEEITDLSQRSTLTSILVTISDASIFQKDLNDFDHAKKLYRQLDFTKEQLFDGAKMDELGYRYGLKICVIVSYLFYSIMFVYLIAN